MLREPSAHGCGCYHKFDRPEKGVVSFLEPEGQFEQGVDKCKKVFKSVSQADKEWKIPNVRFFEGWGLGLG